MAYGVLKLILFPAIWISGITYLLYGFWQELVLGRGWLEWVASVHVAAPMPSSCSSSSMSIC
jgi:hypothetical protein